MLLRELSDLVMLEWRVRRSADREQKTQKVARRHADSLYTLGSDATRCVIFMPPERKMLAATEELKNNIAGVVRPIIRVRGQT